MNGSPVIEWEVLWRSVVEGNTFIFHVRTSAQSTPIVRQVRQYHTKLGAIGLVRKMAKNIINSSFKKIMQTSKDTTAAAVGKRVDKGAASTSDFFNDTGAKVKSTVMGAVDSAKTNLHDATKPAPQTMGESVGASLDKQATSASDFFTDTGAKIKSTVMGAVDSAKTNLHEATKPATPTAGERVGKFVDSMGSGGS
jgi:hypothetical protein